MTVLPQLVEFCFLGYGLGTKSVSSFGCPDNRSASVGTTQVKTRFFFFGPFRRLVVTQAVFFMVPDERQTSTSSTAAAISMDTKCAGLGQWRVDVKRC